MRKESKATDSYVRAQVRFISNMQTGFSHAVIVYHFYITGLSVPRIVPKRVLDSVGLLRLMDVNEEDRLFARFFGRLRRLVKR